MRALCFRALLLVDVAAAAAVVMTVVTVLLAGEHVLQAEES